MYRNFQLHIGGISIVYGFAYQLSAVLSFYQSLVSFRRFRQGHKFSSVLLLIPRFQVKGVL